MGTDDEDEEGAEKPDLDMERLLTHLSTKGDVEEKFKYLVLSLNRWCDKTSKEVTNLDEEVCSLGDLLDNFKEDLRSELTKELKVVIKEDLRHEVTDLKRREVREEIRTDLLRLVKEELGKGFEK